MFRSKKKNLEKQIEADKGIYYKEESAEYYDEYYNSLIEGGAIGIVASIYHKKLESRHNSKFSTVLEVGAGSGQHFKYVKHDFDTYISSDLRKPAEQLNLGSDKRLEFRVLDAQNLESIETGSIDRLIATCVLPHLPDPESALKEWRRVVKDGGVLDLYIPAEPSILLDIAQRLTTKRKVQSFGLDYSKMRYSGHRMHYPLLIMLINNIFSEDQLEVRHFPLRIPYWQFSLWSTFRIRKSAIDS
jgi:phosphatidylethanolamine/phosphatidyl-N-methylethanolamine N-methyltransferase